VYNSPPPKKKKKKRAKDGGRSGKKKFLHIFYEKRAKQGSIGRQIVMAANALPSSLLSCVEVALL
jgi:hypothetical protein